MKQRKKLTCMTFLCMTAQLKEQSGNKTGHRNNTATKRQDMHRRLWGTCAYREHQRMGFFSSDHAVKKSSFNLFLKKQRCGRNKLSTVFSWSLKHPHKKKKKMWAKWPVWRISTGDKIARTKSATEVYLLFPLYVFCHSSWVAMKYKKTKLFYSSFRTAEKF